MPERPCRIQFLPSGRQLEVAPGTRLFDATRQAGLPLASSCDGDAICGRCKLEVLAGQDHLSPPSPAEARLLTRLRADPAVRIACEARVEGDITVTAGYW